MVYVTRPEQRHPGIVAVFGAHLQTAESLIYNLAEEGYRIRLFSSRLEEVEQRTFFGVVGQVSAHYYSNKPQSSKKKAVQSVFAKPDLQGVSAVFILSELLCEKLTVSERGHADYVKEIVQAAQDVGAQIYYLSHAGSSPASSSSFLASRSNAETHVLSVANSIVFRPSIAFSGQNDLFSRYQVWRKLFPCRVPLFHSKATLVSPLSVKNLSEGMFQIFMRHQKALKAGRPESVKKIWMMGSSSSITIGCAIALSLGLSPDAKVFWRLPGGVGGLLTPLRWIVAYGTPLSRSEIKALSHSDLSVSEADALEFEALLDDVDDLKNSKLNAV